MSEQLPEWIIALSNELESMHQPLDSMHAGQLASIIAKHAPAQSDDTGKVLLTKEQADKIRNALESARNALESSYNVLEYPGTRDCHQGRAADECTEVLKVFNQEGENERT